MTAYYNEIDPFAAQWLRELISAGHIAPGDVDERSIEDVAPDDIKNYTQCHFFAGIGVWSYALRIAGWPDDRPVWTGSCPCQPFSQAGQGNGFDDERHLWPSWHWLIENCKPETVFGEQVASAEVVGTKLEADFAIAVRGGNFARANNLAKKLARAKSTNYQPRWLDLVQRDLEGIGYTFRPDVLGAHSVGAPNQRKRLFWVADTGSEGFPQRISDGRVQLEALGSFQRKTVERCSDNGGVAKPNGTGLQSGGETSKAVGYGDTTKPDGGDSRPNQTNGFWRDADWLFCRDGKWRPVEPGLKPLVDGVTARVGLLRGYGNAINAEAAKAFIGAFLDTK